MVYTDVAEQFGEGRCVNCGLLSLIRGNGEVVELPMAIRMGWEHTSDPPRCLIYQRHLAEELNAWASGTKRIPPDGISEVIRRPQTCDRWFGYVEGLSPQDHLRRQDLVAMEELRRQQAEMIAAVQTTLLKEQTAIAAEHAKMAASLARVVESERQQTTAFNAQTAIFNKWFLGMAVIAAVLALGPLFFPSGLPWVADKLDRGDKPGVVMVVTATPGGNAASDCAQLEHEYSAAATDSAARYFFAQLAQRECGLFAPATATPSAPQP